MNNTKLTMSDQATAHDWLQVPPVLDTSWTVCLRECHRTMAAYCLPLTRSICAGSNIKHCEISSMSQNQNDICRDQSLILF